MGKAVHKTNSLKCEDLTSESEECRTAEVIYSMIASQNYQIQLMRKVLEAKNYLLTDDCDISLKKYQELTSSENSTILQLSENVSAPPMDPDARNLQGEICTSENNVFTVVVDLFAGELALSISGVRKPIQSNHWYRNWRDVHVYPGACFQLLSSIGFRVLCRRLP
jgi:hypothetical protein